MWVAMLPESPWRGLEEVVDLERIAIIVVRDADLALLESVDADLVIDCIIV